VAEESFAQLYKESQHVQAQNVRVMGKVVSIENGQVLVDVGLKSEGYIKFQEFEDEGYTSIAPGDEVEVYVEYLENKYGETTLSRQRVLREKAWEEIEEIYANEREVKGDIIRQVRGGFIVKIKGLSAFLPGSQVGLYPVDNADDLLETRHSFIILKIDKKHDNMVVSRRAILEKERSKARDELFSTLKEGQILTGTIKNITDYGAFIDLGGSDGLMHMTDIAWKRIRHPSDVLKIGEKIKVKVIRFIPESRRISLSMKHLTEDPWERVEEKYPIKSQVQGQVTKITHYGAFTQLEEGIEGLVHISEMTWAKHDIQPQQLLKEGDMIDVKVINIDREKRRISLSRRECIPKPWDRFIKNHNVGDVIEGRIRNIASDIGLFVSIDDTIDGLVHISALSWNTDGKDAIKNYREGDTVKAKIIDINGKKEHVSLSIRELEDDPTLVAIEKTKKDDVVTCVIQAIDDNDITVLVHGILKGTIQKREVTLDEKQKSLSHYNVDDTIDAVVTGINSKKKTLQLSIKKLEEKKEQEDLEIYGTVTTHTKKENLFAKALAKAQKASAKTDSDTKDDTGDDTPKQETPSS